MKEKPKEKRLIDGYLCSYEIYFHEWNSAIESALASMDETYASYISQIENLQEEQKYLDGTPYENLEKEIDDLTEALDEKVPELLKPILDYKVVIISSCSC
jgi:hypothetical protein